MLKNLTAKVSPIVKMKPWVSLAVLMAVTLLGYYLLLGVRYWQASSKSDQLSAQIQQASQVVRQILSNGSAQTQVPPSSIEEQRQQVQRLFTNERTDTLVSTLSSIAQETGVAMTSLKLGDPKFETTELIRYQLQPVTITLEGTTNNVYLFLTWLQTRVKTVEINDVATKFDQDTAQSQIQLSFYMSAKEVSGEKGAK